MTRPTRVLIDDAALIHNVHQVRLLAPGKKIIAMVKANAYGCGLSSVIPVIESEVDAFGVASLEEALAIRELRSNKDCILFQGVFSPDELQVAADKQFQIIIHQPLQLQWLLNTPLKTLIKVWVKVDTGMHRLGFNPEEAAEIFEALRSCKWVDKDIGLLTHLACADEPDNPANQQQLKQFNSIKLAHGISLRSIANSAAIISLPKAHADAVRPGIMLYGVSPFTDKTGAELGLRPVMRFVSTISAIHHYSAHSPVGYNGIWQSDTPSIIAVVPVGYGDGYPRHIEHGQVWINGTLAPIVGRVSMDMLTIDITHCPEKRIGEPVELWGEHIPVEHVARQSGTIAYELICQVAPRVRTEH